MLTAMLACTSAWAGAGVIYVDADATGADNGTSWNDAFVDLQDGLALANVGDEVWVAAGVYRPAAGTDREASFQLKSLVEIYGGFKGDESVREARNWRSHLTVLDGDIDSDGSLEGNSYHVVVGSGADSTAVLDGFTIIGGNAAGGVGTLTASGGGLLIYEGSPTLVNLRLVRNQANYLGGGVFNAGESSPTLTNVSFLGNFSGLDGGGMSSSSGSPILTNVVFSGNYAERVGGGLDNWGTSTPEIRNAIFWNNEDETGTGTPTSSIVNFSASVPSIRYSLIHGCNPGGNWNTECGSDAGNNLFDADPRFVHTPQPSDAVDAVGNLKLRADSPAIDAGNNAFIETPHDLSGNQRIVSGTADLGPYERPSGACPPAGILFVGSSGIEPADGSSWARSFSDLQDALAVSETCSIWVEQGLYKPAIDPWRSATFRIPDGLELYGGFSGSETNLQQRSWQSHPTILSGDLDSNDSADESGIVPIGFLAIGDNAYHVVTSIVTSSATRLDGFTITAGSAEGENLDNRGGGLINLGGTLVLENLAFVGNDSSGGGAGMLNVNASPSMTNIHFRGNTTSGFGGGLHNREGSSPAMTQITFIGNQAFRGGGVYNFISNPEMIDIVFRSNFAGLFGGGMANLNDSAPKLTNVAFIGNRADFGGGMSNESNSDADLENVLFLGNYASEFGGGLSNTGSSPTLSGVSFSRNVADELGGGIDNFGGSDPTITNIILWNNLDQTGSDTATASVVNDNSTPIFSYSLIQSCNSGAVWNADCGTDGGSNLPDSDPLFASSPDPVPGLPSVLGNLRLQAGSPAIDVGDNDAVSVPTDLFGNERIVDSIVDLGPYEYFLRPDLLFHDRFSPTLPRIRE